MAINLDAELSDYEASTAPTPEPAGDLDEELSRYEASQSAPVEAVPEASAMDKLSDIGVTARKGILGVPQFAVGLADLVSKGKAGKAVEEAGVDFEAMQERLGRRYSPEYQEASKEVQRAMEEEGIMPTLKALKENPAVAGHTIVESLPSIVGGQVIAKGVMKAAPKIISALTAGSIGEGAVTAGQLAEQVRSRSETGELTPQQAAVIAATGGITGAVGAGFGKVSNKLGIGNIETSLLGPSAAAARTATNKGFLRRGAEAGGVEAAQEAVQSGQETVGGNIAEGKEDIFKGVGGSAVLGAVSGAGMGAPIGALTRNAPQRIPPPSETTSQEVATEEVSEEDLPEEPEYQPGEGVFEDEEALPEETEAEPTVEEPEVTPEVVAEAERAQVDPALDTFLRGYQGIVDRGLPTLATKKLKTYAEQAGTYDPKDTAIQTFEKLKEATYGPVERSPERIRQEASDLAAAPILEQVSSAPDGVFKRSTLAALDNGATQPQVEAISTAQEIIDAQAVQEEQKPAKSVPDWMLKEAAQHEANLEVEESDLDRALSEYETYAGDTDAKAIRSDTGLANVPRETRERGPEDSGNDLYQTQQEPQRGGEETVLEQRDKQPQTQKTPIQPTGGLNGKGEDQTKETRPLEETGKEIEEKPIDEVIAKEHPLDETNGYQPSERPEDNKKAFVNFQDFPIAIENPAGTTRSGTDADGKQWSTTMKSHYGEIKAGEGADGDAVDVFIPEGLSRESIDSTDKAYIVDQIDPKTFEFDEHKVMLGYPDSDSAIAAYRENYEPGWKGLGGITEMPIQDFKKWVNEADKTKPVAEDIQVRETAAGAEAPTTRKSIQEEPAPPAGRRTEIVKRSGKAAANAARLANRRASDVKEAKELKREININHVTGIPNKRAFLNKPVPPFMASVDIDSLKYVNDNLGEGHVSGDKLLKAVAQVLSKYADAYHVSGDEILVRGNSREELVQALEDANAELSSGQHVITSPTGSFSKPSFSYGISETNQESDMDKKAILEEALIRADLEMVENKKAREASGARAGRGERPPGFEGGSEPTPTIVPENAFATQAEAVEHLAAQFGKGIHRLVSIGVLNFTEGKSSWPKEARQESGAEAIYDNRVKKVFVDLQATSRERMTPVILHELGEHFNLKRMLGEKGYKSLQDQITNQAKIRGSFAERVWREVATTPGYSNLEVGGEAFISEVIAKVGEYAPNAPFYRRLLSKIKAFLVERGLGTGFISGTFTQDDLHELLKTSLRSAARVNISEIRATSPQATVGHSISPTVNVDGVERPTTDSSGKSIHPTKEGLVNFWRWFGDSKAVDEQGRPMAVFHGTTADFTQFERGYSEPESDLGAGFYFSNNPDDTEANYAGEGPDLRSKLDRMAEQILSQADESGKDISYEDALAEAKERYMQHEGVSMPTYLSMQNPVVIGGEDQTFFTFSEGYNEETEEYTGEFEGTLLGILDAVDSVASEGVVKGVVGNDVTSRILDEVYGNDGIDAESLVETIKRATEYSWMEFDGDYRIANSEFARRVMEEAGYDGWIDRTVGTKFHDMEGLNEDTGHYVVFESNKVKSATGNTGAFSKESKDIRYSVPTSTNTTVVSGKLRARLNDASKTGLALMTVRQIVEVSKKYLPLLKRYEDHMQRRNREKDSRLRVADRTLTKWKGLGKIGMKKVSDVMHGSTLVDVSASKDWTGIIDNGDGTFTTYSQTAFGPKYVKHIETTARHAPGFIRSSKNSATFNKIGEAQGFIAALDNIDSHQTAFRNGNNPSRTKYQDVNRARKAEHPSLRRAFQALPQEGKEVYEETYAQHTTLFNDRVAALEGRINEAVLDGKTRARMIAEMRLQFESRSLNWYYAPLKRYGSHWFHGKDSRGRPWFRTYESTYERNQALKEFEQQGGTETRLGTSLEGIMGIGGTTEGMSDTFIRSINDAISDRIPGDVGESLRNDIYQLYLSTLPDISIRHSSMNRKGTLGFEEDGMRVFASSMHHGASQLANMTEGREMQKVLQDAKAVKELAESPNKVYQKGTESRAAKLLLNDWQKYGQPDVIENERKTPGLPADRKNLLDAALKLRNMVSRPFTGAGQPTAIPALADVQESLNRVVSKNDMLISESAKITDEYKDKAAYVIDELEKSYMAMVATGSSSLERIAQSLRQVSFMWTLGFGLSSGVANLMQTGVVAAPVLYGRYQSGSVVSNLSRVTRDLVEATRLGITRGNSGRDIDGNSSITVVLNDRLQRLQQSGGSQRAIQELRDEILLLETLKEDGTISRTQSHDVIGIGQEGETHGGALHDLSKIAGWVFHHGERANREVTALMSYRLARKGDTPRGIQPMGHVEAMDYARYVNNKSHGDYTTENAARLFRGPLAGVALQYKKYTQMMMYMWGSNTVTALRDWKSMPEATAEQKAAKDMARRESTEARRTLLGLLVTQLSVAGTTGLPLMGMTMWTINFVASAASDDDEPYNLEEEIRIGLTKMWGETTATTVTKGFINAFTPVNIASRVGLRDIIFREPLVEMEGRDAATAMLAQLTGPSGSLLTKAYEATRLAGDGHVYRALETAAPKAIADILKGSRFAYEDARDMKGKVVKEMSAMEALSQSIGFGSSKLEVLYAERGYAKRSEDAIREARSDIVGKISRSILKGEDKEEGIELIRAWNARNPDWPIDRKAIIASARRIKQNEMAKGNRGYSVNPKLKRLYEEKRLRDRDEEEDEEDE